MLSRLQKYASLIRFSHTIFALPFALTGALFANEQTGLLWDRVGWILLAMFLARTAAMGFNRIVDARFDELNPRTRTREIPQREVSILEASAIVFVSAMAFVATTYPLGELCFVLSPVALVIVFWYSLAKRFTHYTQFFLGLALAVAPVGGWLATGGGGSWIPWFLAVATGFWVGGFDILYACEDLDFDRKQGLRSIPVRYGVARSLWISRGCHVVTVCALGALALVMPLGPMYLGGVGAVALLLIYEQSLVTATDLSRVKEAFDLNGYVGLLYLFWTAGALYVV
jgi:4-hydroxybenzoate polyprenyltransferase